jgi:hypothetical protein
MPDFRRVAGLTEQYRSHTIGGQPTIRFCWTGTLASAAARHEGAARARGQGLQGLDLAALHRLESVNAAGRQRDRRSFPSTGGGPPMDGVSRRARPGGSPRHAPASRSRR